MELSFTNIIIRCLFILSSLKDGNGIAKIGYINVVQPHLSVCRFNPPLACRLSGKRGPHRLDAFQEHSPLDWKGHDVKQKRLGQYLIICTQTSSAQVFSISYFSAQFLGSQRRKFFEIHFENILCPSPHTSLATPAVSMKRVISMS